MLRLGICVNDMFCASLLPASWPPCHFPGPPSHQHGWGEDRLAGDPWWLLALVCLALMRLLGCPAGLRKAINVPALCL